MPAADEALRHANALTGTVSHASAAAHWGWELKTVPTTPHLTFRRNRNIGRAQRTFVTPHWANLSPDDVRDGLVTSKERTLQDCLTTLPFDEALTVADSSLRHRDISPRSLRRVVERIRGPGSAQARRVAALANGDAANPFESVLRSHSLEVAGLDLQPQVEIRYPGFFARPDLVDVDRGLVVEADSHTWHSSRAALRRDCRRYNGLVLRGWLVLRFVWEDVMVEPHLVRAALEGLAQLAVERAKLGLTVASAA
jgi:very-short-patch-repair endonuclease